MDPSFWLEKWQSKDIGFHQSTAHPMLVKWLHVLKLPTASRIFVPLCGKTLDIAWLLSQKYQVIGCELSEIAVEQLFAELQITPVVENLAQVKLFRGPGIDILVGDIFAVSVSMLGRVDAVYDRAALVALPEQMRIRYVRHLQKITAKAPQLVICFEYNQQLLDGPPFSIDEVKIKHYYEAEYAIESLENSALQYPLKGICPAQEHIWLLS